MPKITTKTSGGCAGKNCPAIWETDTPGLIAVQGMLAPAASLEAAGEMPADESVVFVPASLLSDWPR